MKSIFAIFLVLIVSINVADARTVGSVEIICPIDGTKFTATLEMSGSRFGTALDLKPIGAIGAPPLMAQCPTDHFVVYQDKKHFKQGEIEKIKTYIHSKEYKDLVAQGNTTYYLTAKIQAHLGKDRLDVAFTYLQATWQVENDKEKYLKYSTDAMNEFNAYLKDHHKKNRDWMLSQSLVGEILRRQGKFKQAHEHFEKIKQIKEITDDEVINRIIDLQLKLIAKSDSTSHEVPRPSEAGKK